MNGECQSFEFGWPYNAIGEVEMSGMVLLLLLLCTASVCVCVCVCGCVCVYVWEIIMTGVPEVVEDHSIHLCFLLGRCTQNLHQI